MTNAKHTPGPWRHQAATGIGAPYGIFSKPTEACVAGVHIIHKNGVTKANALLIAAAPELLEVAQLEELFLSSTGPTNAEWQSDFETAGWKNGKETAQEFLHRKRRAAIAKAYGEMELAA